MVIFMLISVGVVALLFCGDMARMCIEDGAWALAVASMVMAVVTVVGTVAACIAVAQA